MLDISWECINSNISNMLTLKYLHYFLVTHFSNGECNLY
jgi:hypothetical protein